jgi:hypothetical protein
LGQHGHRKPHAQTRHGNKKEALHRLLHGPARKNLSGSVFAPIGNQYHLFGKCGSVGAAWHALFITGIRHPGTVIYADEGQDGMMFDPKTIGLEHARGKRRQWKPHNLLAVWPLPLRFLRRAIV